MATHNKSAPGNLQSEQPNAYSQNEAQISDSDEEKDDGDVNFECKPKKVKVKKVSSKNADDIDCVKDEEGKFVCQICNKKLADKKGLKLHIRLHTGENLKRCNICNRGN